MRENTVTVDYHWHPSPWSAHRRQIAIMARDGTILSRSDIPTADGDMLVQGLGLVGSPAIAALGWGLFDRTAAENTFRPWASPAVVPWAAAGGVLSMALTWLVLAHRGMARRSRWRWLVMALLGGMAVPVAALAVWYPSPRRACPSCGHRRWADDRTCPDCGSGWGLPPNGVSQITAIHEKAEDLY